MSLGLFGYISWQTENTYTLWVTIKCQGFKCLDSHCWFSQAIKLATEDAFTLNRLTDVFFLSGKLEMALGICNMALSVLPDAELNWQAYCTRAKVRELLPPPTNNSL